MSADEYLERLRGQLKGFSEQEQIDILDEITSHIESGQEDLGKEKAMAELGTVEEMGRGLRRVHRPNRWVDFLLALVPYFLVSPVIQLGINLAFGLFSTNTPGDPHYYLGGRISILFDLLMVWVGTRRRSPALALFWLTSAIGGLVSVMTREARWIPGQEWIAGTRIESYVLYVLLLGLVAGLLWILRRRQFDLLLVVFALLPLARTAANYGTGQYLMTLSSFPPGQTSNQWMLTLTMVGWVAGLALFFLADRREVRWLALQLMAVSGAYPQISMYGFFPQVTLMWSASMTLVPLGWALDWFVRRGISRSLAD